MWVWRRRGQIVAFLAAALVCLPWGRVQPRLLDDVRNFVFDSYQRLSPRPYDPQTPARVVGIDEESLLLYGQWPWPRGRLAELTRKLKDLGAAAIAFDFVFAEKDRASLENIVSTITDARARKELERIMARQPGNDGLFAAALTDAPTVLGATLAQAGADPEWKAGFAFAGDDPTAFLPTFPAAARPLPELAAAAHGIGATNWLPDRDQIVRQTPLVLVIDGKLAPSLALEALRVAQAASTIVVRASNTSGETAFGARTGVNAVKVGDIEIAAGPDGAVRPRYAYMNAARDISAAAVLQDKVARAEIEGRIIFVGALATGLGDVRATPLEPSVPGVEVHAQVVESLAAGALLSRPDWAPGLEFIAAILAFAIIALLLLVAPPAASAATAVIGIVGLFVGSHHLFSREGLLLDPAYPSLTIAVTYLVGAFALWRQEQASKRHVREAFGRFVSPAVVERLSEHPERLTLGGEAREITILCSDLRGFSALSEGMTAREIGAFMNAYFTPMTDAILECEGTIDKYIGDAILAFWNAPLDVEEHAAKAVRAALRMRAELSVFNAARAAQAQAAGRAHMPVAVGLGLHVGECSVGNMGSIRRFDYSALGDPVNLASRLEGASKMFRTDIIVSGDVAARAIGAAWLDLGAVIVVGRAAPTRIFALAGDPETAASPAFTTWRDAHDAMMAQGAAGNFAAAAAAADTLATGVADDWRPLYHVLSQRFGALAEGGASAQEGAAWKLDSK